MNIERYKVWLKEISNSTFKQLLVVIIWKKDTRISW